jgi:drug/metabolite transporter (DMT)-like permease
MMRPEQRLLWAQVLVWFIPALWAVNYFCARLAPGVVDPHILALGRWAIAGLILGGLARHEIWQARHEIWSDRWQYLALGTLGMLICGAWVYWGAQTTSAMNIALIYAAAPVLIAWGSAIWLDERMRPRQMFGVALALAGVVHVVVKGNWVALTQMQWSMGDVLIMAATLSWAAYALLQKKWVCTLSSTARLACICAGGVITLLPFALWESLQPQAPQWTWYATILLLAVALVPGIGAYWIYAWAQKTLGASRTSMTLYLGPLWGALVSWGVLGESLGWHHAVGSLLILPGVALVVQPSAVTKTD